MSTDAIRRPDFTNLARDPLVRLVMASDGVSEAEFVAVLQTAQRAVNARLVAGWPCDSADRKHGRGLRIVRSGQGHCALV